MHFTPIKLLHTASRFISSTPTWALTTGGFPFANTIELVIDGTDNLLIDGTDDLLALNSLTVTGGIADGNNIEAINAVVGTGVLSQATSGTVRNLN